MFPFEDEAIRKGFWPVLDRRACRWRAVGWGLYDPEYDENTSRRATINCIEDSADEEESDEGDVSTSGIASSPSRIEQSGEEDREDDHLVTAFSLLELQQSEQKTLFDGFCVRNEVTQARFALLRSTNAAALLERTKYPGDKPVLLMTCEEGHVEMMDVLLEYGAPLEATDADGNTALQRALYYGYGTVACLLIKAGF